MMRKFSFSLWFSALCLISFFALGTVSCAVNVESSTTDNTVAVTSVKVSSENNKSEISVGEALQLTATVSPSNASDKTVTWKSSDPSVATVNSTGLVTAKKAGSVKITATAGGKSGSKSLTVKTEGSSGSGEESEIGDDEEETQTDTVVAGATNKTSVGTSGKSFEAQSSDPSDYTVLVWSDEFEGTALKTENWQYEEGTGNWGWGNNEQQYYTKGNNCAVEGGVLHITAKSDFTSTRIKTADKKDFKYGKIEARIKCEEGQGSWPAFWMLGNGNDRDWPGCGEIDIMEHANEVAYVNNTLHWNYEGSSSKDYTKHGEYGTTSAGKVANFKMNEWHTYSAVWTESNIKMYVDGKETYSMGIGNSSNGTDAFNNSFYFIINFAMGGLYVNNTDKATFTKLPWNMYVDYIRVYQDENATVDGKSVVPVTSVTLSGNDSVTVGETITLSASVNPSNATEKTVTWSSSDTSVATVSSSGVVTGKKAGTATITATAGGKSGTKTITVESDTVAVTSVTVSGSSSVKVGKTITLTAAVSPDNATDKTVTWTSSKTDVATVSSTGVVTGKKAGSATITATAGGKSGTKTITVLEESSSSIEAPLDGYSLVWNDEFDTADSDGTPLSTKWGYDIGAGQSNCTDGKNPGNYAWGNGELQWYSDNDPDNTYVSDGTLKIVAKKENSNGMAYTSGRIVTRSIPNAQWKYGYIEMSAKIPNDAGVWPAFWMLDQDIYDGQGWPGSGEIDIMESSVNLWGSNKVYGTLHCTAGSGGSPVFTKESTVTFSDGKFHKYAVDWDDDHIDWYYDDVKVFTYEPASYEQAPWPFKQEFYIILNLAVGGNLGGSVPENFTSSTMEVDYVRVWQKDSGYTDRSGAVVVTGAPEATVAKSIPDGAKVVYDSSATITNPVTNFYDHWNGGWTTADYAAGGKTIKQVSFTSLNGNSCGAWDISGYAYGANAKLHMSVYAAQNFSIKPVQPNSEFAQTVSKAGTAEWVDVEIDLGAANTLSQIGFVSSVVQNIWVDHVYITESDSGSGGSGESGETGGSGGEGGESGETGGDGINWSVLEFAGDGAGGGAYSNKYKFYSEDGVGNLVNIQSSFGEEPGLYVTFNNTGAPSACSLDASQYAQQGAGMLFYISAFTAKETTFTVTTGSKAYTCAVYYADGTE